MEKMVTLYFLSSISVNLKLLQKTMSTNENKDKI